MRKRMYTEALDFVQDFMGKASHYSPFVLCEQLGISVVTDKQLKKDGYLICSDGLKLIFVSSDIHNRHRREFVVAHEVGHFLMHQDHLYCCANVSVTPSTKINTSEQEKEANTFASELLAPFDELSTLMPNRSLRFSDISSIANHFDISMSHAAIKCVQNSKTESEILLCYNDAKLKWFVTKEPYKWNGRIPACCPLNLENVKKPVYVTGPWDSLFEGSVYQDVFHPYENQHLVLLSGNMIEEESSYTF